MQSRVLVASSWSCSPVEQPFPGHDRPVRTLGYDTLALAKAERGSLGSSRKAASGLGLAR